MQKYPKGSSWTLQTLFTVNKEGFLLGGFGDFNTSLEEMYIEYILTDDKNLAHFCKKYQTNLNI